MQKVYNAFSWFMEKVFGLEPVSTKEIAVEQIQPPNPYQDYKICKNGVRSKSNHLTVTNPKSAFYGRTLCGYANVKDIVQEDIKIENLNEATMCKKCLKMLAKIRGEK